MKFTSAKTIAAAIGTTATAIASAAAAVRVALSDGSLDGGDISTIVTAVIVAGASIYSVWRTPNKVVTPDGE